MPKEGFCSITVSQEFYDSIEKKFNENKAVLRSINIYSVSGFYALVLTTVIDNPKLYNKTITTMQNKIEYALNNLKKKVE